MIHSDLVKARHISQGTRVINSQFFASCELGFLLVFFLSLFVRPLFANLSVFVFRKRCISNVFVKLWKLLGTIMWIVFFDRCYANGCPTCNYLAASASVVENLPQQLFLSIGKCETQRGGNEVSKKTERFYILK